MRIFVRLWFTLFALVIPGNGSSAKAGESTGFSDHTAIEKRLETTRAELKELPGTADPALHERLQQLEAACQYHLAAADLLSATRDRLAKAREESAAWRGFSLPSPYPLPLLDEIRESIATLENSERTAQAQLRIFNAEVEELREKLASHQQAERRLLEQAGATRETVSLQPNYLEVKLENLSARITAEGIGRCQLRIATEQAGLGGIVAKKELASHKLAAIRGKTRLSSADLDEIQQKIARERDTMTRAIVAESSAGRVPGPLLTWSIEFLDLKKTFWENRFTAVNNQDTTEVRVAVNTLKTIESRVDDWVRISELRLAGGDEETANLDPNLLRDAVLEVRAMQRLIGFAIADLDGSGLRGTGTSMLGKIGDTLQSIWNAELYLVEESDIVDGKKIPIYRAVTVGKLVRLAFILVAGWFILRFLSRRIQALVVRRANIPQSTANLAGKWAFGVGFGLLILYGLGRVSIPLTVFAFLGGALAIGVGFGTQTILKNFISGIIILFERPLKVGDVVEVSNITGTIRNIGLRASVIQHFDGIETLVPNSILIENQLTNWTFSSSIIRHTILVGVAYGSPTREVSRVLLAVAASHGLVIKDPPPEVRFDNFGTDSLHFTLLFWLDSRKIARNQLASDLRFMIDGAFAEAGIVVAFPQRDIHFNSDKPLRVEFVDSTE